MRVALCLSLVSTLLGAAPRLSAGEGEPAFPRLSYHVDLGANLIPEADVEPAPTFPVPVPPGQAAVSFDPGVRLDVGGGYAVWEWLQVGLGTGYVWNQVDQLLGRQVTGGQITQVPAQVEVTVQYTIEDRVTLFGGGSGGGVYQWMSSGATSGGRDKWLSVDRSDWAAAFGAYGGVTYRLNQRIHLGLVYRFLRTGSQSWDVLFWPDYLQTLEVDPLTNHGMAVFFRADL